MNPPAKTPRRTKRPAAAPIPKEGASLKARRQAAAILEVLAGVRRPSEAAQVLGTSLPRYYQLEQRALAGLVAACEPAPRGPRQNVAHQLARLEREKQHLARECDRQQALVRATQRSLGLVLPPRPKPDQEQPAEAGSSQRRRHRRPAIRALRASQALQRESPEVAAVTETPMPEPALTSARA